MNMNFLWFLNKYHDTGKHCLLRTFPKRSYVWMGTWRIPKCQPSREWSLGSLIPVPRNTICVFILLTLFLKAKEIWTMWFQYGNCIPKIMCAQSNKVINKPLPLKAELLSESGRENLDSCMRIVLYCTEIFAWWHRGHLLYVFRGSVSNK